MEKVKCYIEYQSFKVGAIGIGVFGPLDAKTGMARHPPRFKRWKDVPLRKIVHKRYKIKIPAWIENDAIVGIFSEK